MTELHSYPPHEQWHDWRELDAKAWPEREERRYTLVPTTCFNCEAGCGLVAYFDQETGEIRKIEGNPEHPGSRGRNCAKGPATLNQVYEPERILHPMKRVGERGEGKWERISWDQALDEIGARIRKAIVEDRHNEIMYHVGRPGEDGYTDRVLRRGASTATTPTPTSARPTPASATSRGWATTGPRRTSPTPR